MNNVPSAPPRRSLESGEPQSRKVRAGYDAEHPSFVHVGDPAFKFGFDKYIMVKTGPTFLVGDWKFLDGTWVCDPTRSVYLTKVEFYRLCVNVISGLADFRERSQNPLCHLGRNWYFYWSRI